MKTQLNAAKIIPVILPLPSWSWNQPCYRDKVGYNWVFTRWRSTIEATGVCTTLSILRISLSWQDYKGFKTSPLLSLHTWNEEYEQNVLNLSGMLNRCVMRSVPGQRSVLPSKCKNFPWAVSFLIPETAQAIKPQKLQPSQLCAFPFLHSSHFIC